MPRSRPPFPRGEVRADPSQTGVGGVEKTQKPHKPQPQSQRQWLFFLGHQ
jgi:hypothetical protein